MSQSDNERGGRDGWSTTIRKSKQAAFEKRRKLRRQLPAPRPAAKRELADALADYHDQLVDYADDRALQTDWTDRLPVDPEALLVQTTTVEQTDESWDSASSTEVDVPLAVSMDGRKLLQIGKELDAIAKELGFAASTRDVTPSEEATMDDLRGLLKARGQTTALEHLPDGDATDIETPYSEDGDEERQGADD